MEKKHIRSIPIRLASDDDVQQAMLSDGTAILVYAELHPQDMLALSFYSASDLMSGNRDPTFCTYITRSDHISRERKGVRYVWRTGKLSTHFGPQMSFHFAGVESLQTVQAFFNSNQAGLQSVHAHQSQIAAARLQNKHQQIMNRIDRQMEIVPPMPEDFEDFVNRDLLPGRYLYYRYSKRAKKPGFCTNCRQDVIVSNPKHSQPGSCPACGAAVVYKSSGRFRHGMWDRGFTCLPQKTAKGFVLRYVEVSRLESPDKRREMCVHEHHRVIFSGDKMTRYTYGRFLSTNMIRWCNAPKQGYHYTDGGCRYPTNLAEIMVGTAWQYSAADLYREPVFTSSLDLYLQCYQQQPFLEYMLKAGLRKLASEVIHKNHRAIHDREKSRLHDLLGVSRAGLRLLIEMDGCGESVHLVRVLENHRIPHDAALVRQIMSEWRHQSIDFVTYVLPHANMAKVMMYANTLSDSHARSDWLDYLRMAEEVGYNLRNHHAMFPKNLKKAHDTVTLLHRERDVLVYASAFQEIAPRLERFSWRPDAEDWIVVAPSTALEIVHEGHALSHCVHSYIRKVIEGQSTILFLRKASAPDKSCITLELHGNQVVQARSKNNRLPASDAQVFIDRYCKWLAKTQAQQAA